MMGQITPKHFGYKKRGRTRQVGPKKKCEFFFLKFKLKKTKKQLTDSSVI